MSIQVAEWLRQREPMLFVAEVVRQEPVGLVTATAAGRRGELVVVPETMECTEAFLMEAMGQAAEILYRLRTGRRQETGYLVRMDRVKLARRVHQAATLSITVELMQAQFQYVTSFCQAQDAGGFVASAEVTHFFKREND